MRARRLELDPAMGTSKAARSDADPTFTIAPSPLSLVGREGGPPRHLYRSTVPRDPPDSIRTARGRTTVTAPKVSHAASYVPGPRLVCGRSSTGSPVPDLRR